jgi:hypothetical protein
MHIYITEENEALLRETGGSMSGLINELLAEYFAKLKKPTERANYEKDADG